MTGKTSRVRGLAIAAVAWLGLGGAAMRALVETPAWRHLGTAAWADFSRQRGSWYGF